MSSHYERLAAETKITANYCCIALSGKMIMFHQMHWLCVFPGYSFQKQNALMLVLWLHLPWREEEMNKHTVFLSKSLFCH